MNKACLADIIKRHLSEYRNSHPLSPQQASVCQSILQCRTEAMSGYVQECLACGHQQESFRSCRNRHCPQCQQTKSQDWCDQQMEQILPVNYHHMVFTLPHALNGWAQLHPEEIVHLLFRAAWETLKQFADGGRHLSGQLGATFVLHTWGQALIQHIHVHCMIPAGALSEDGQLSRITDGATVKQMLDALMAKSWVVFTKPHLQKPETIVQYLARYIQRSPFVPAGLWK